mmetsp:Transcript_40359/g.94434  ORF Transcript_40359/g.94434 Transcript_40359/m.94434 type:complete len:897 (+) Transcript_40359:411-3101(+)
MRGAGVGHEAPERCHGLGNVGAGRDSRVEQRTVDLHEELVIHLVHLRGTVLDRELDGGVKRGRSSLDVFEAEALENPLAVRTLVDADALALLVVDVHAEVVLDRTDAGDAPQLGETLYDAVVKPLLGEGVDVVVNVDDDERDEILAVCKLPETVARVDRCVPEGDELLLEHQVPAPGGLLEPVDRLDELDGLALAFGVLESGGRRHVDVLLELGVEERAVDVAGSDLKLHLHGNDHQQAERSGGSSRSVRVREVDAVDLGEAAGDEPSLVLGDLVRLRVALPLVGELRAHQTHAPRRHDPLEDPMALHVLHLRALRSDEVLLVRLLKHLPARGHDVWKVRAPVVLNHVLGVEDLNQGSLLVRRRVENAEKLGVVVVSDRLVLVVKDLKHDGILKFRAEEERLHGAVEEALVAPEVLGDTTADEVRSVVAVGSVEVTVCHPVESTVDTSRTSCVGLVERRDISQRHAPRRRTPRRTSPPRSPTPSAHWARQATPRRSTPRRLTPSVAWLAVLVVLVHVGGRPFLLRIGLPLVCVSLLLLLELLLLGLVGWVEQALVLCVRDFLVVVLAVLLGATALVAHLGRLEEVRLGSGSTRLAVREVQSVLARLDALAELFPAEGGWVSMVPCLEVGPLDLDPRAPFGVRACAEGRSHHDVRDEPQVALDVAKAVVLADQLVKSDAHLDEWRPKRGRSHCLDLGVELAPALRAATVGDLADDLPEARAAFHLGDEVLGDELDLGAAGVAESLEDGGLVLGVDRDAATHGDSARVGGVVEGSVALLRLDAVSLGDVQHVEELDAMELGADPVLKHGKEVIAVRVVDRYGDHGLGPSRAGDDVLLDRGLAGERARSTGRVVRRVEAIASLVTTAGAWRVDQGIEAVARGVVTRLVRHCGHRREHRW